MQLTGGGSQYGVPPSDMSPFTSPGAGPRTNALSIDPLHHNHQLQQQQPSTQPTVASEAASPISSRLPPPPMSSSAGSTPRPQASAFDELAPAVAGGFPDDEALAAAAGEEAERGAAAGGNRWPRQETLALLKIRSEMDAAFRDATLKGPLWEDVSRKLAELGYTRSAKKCKEKFENVHKYYKRTKEGRAGRQDGKSYRFFSQMEALNNGGGGGAATSNAVAAPPLPAASPTTISFSAAMAGGPSITRIQPSPISSLAPPSMASAPARLAAEVTPVGGPHGISSSAATAAAIAGLTFSSNSSSSEESEESDEEVTEDADGSQEGRKRKRSNSGGDKSKSIRKMMTFIEGLMKQVMERQEAMQQRFLETIEKREQDRMIREEAWRRQEMARLNLEQEHLAHERAMATSRDNALISYLQKVTGQTIPISIAAAVTTPAISVMTLAPAPQMTIIPPPPQPEQQPHQPSQPAKQKHHQKSAPMPIQPLQQQPPAPLPPSRQSAETIRNQPSVSELVAGAELHDTGGTSVSFETSMLSPSRWPQAEVHALIKIRSGLDSKYQEAGPKGPLWEEISAAMQRLGYNRSSKRCKEKWENINKYFKKVKESNKKRPEDAKTCPYFHQLDTLYRKKLAAAGGSGGVLRQQKQENDLDPERPDAMAPSQTSEQSQRSSPEIEKNGDNNSNSKNGGNSDSNQGSGGAQTTNGAHPSNFCEEGMKKPEDIVKELMQQRHQQNPADEYDKLDDADSDNMEQDDDDDDDDDDDEERKMQYKIQFQRPKVNGTNGGETFVAMVQ